MDFSDVRIFIPRIRRELDPTGVGSAAAPGYTDDMLKDIAADAIGELILTVGATGFPYVLSISNASAATTPYEFEYSTAPELPLELHSLIAVQAAIGQVHKDLTTLVTSEKISDEGSSWEIQRSATLFKERWRALLARRAEILTQLAVTNPTIIEDNWISLLSERSTSLAATMEPYYREV